MLLLALAACANARIPGADVDAAGDDAVDAADDVDAPVVGPDASACARTPCDILTQCGCEGTPATPVCDLDFAMLATGNTKCRADMFSGNETTVCTMATTCDGGHVCVGGRCARYCDADDDCPGAGGLCIIDITQGNPPMPIPNAPKVCSTDCVPSNPANPTCPTGWGCHIYLYDPNTSTMGDERFLTDCDAPGTLATGATCARSDQCAPGADCVTLNPGGPQCRPTCTCPGGNCAAGICPAGAGTCRGYTTPISIGGVTYGACF
jgi:hypothetical protein